MKLRNAVPLTYIFKLFLRVFLHFLTQSEPTHTTNQGILKYKSWTWSSTRRITISLSIISKQGNNCQDKFLSTFHELCVSLLKVSGKRGVRAFLHSCVRALLLSIHFKEDSYIFTITMKYTEIWNPETVGLINSKLYAEGKLISFSSVLS